MSKHKASLETSVSPRQRLSILLWLVTLAVAFSGIVAINLVEKHTQKHIDAHLRLVLDGAATMLDYAFKTSARQGLSLAEDPILKAIIHEHGSIANGYESERLNQLLATRFATPEYLGVVVTISNDRPLLASEPALALAIGDFRFEGSPGTRGDQGDPEYSLPLNLKLRSKEKEYMGLAIRIPLSDSKDLQKQLHLWLVLDARFLFGNLLQAGRSGTTGELYLFDRQGLMLSDSRFNDHLYQIGLLQSGQEAALNLQVRDPLTNLLEGPAIIRKEHDRWPFTKAAASAIAGINDADLLGFPDYRGILVVGAWHWFSEYGFGLTHEIDHKEAYYNKRILQIVVYSLILLLFIATIAATFYFMRVAGAEAQQRASQERVKELNTQIAHVNRLATMGEMASGLAHEINQPLAAISNYTRSVLNALEDPHSFDKDKIMERLQLVEQNALRAGEVIRRIRKFVARHEIQMTPLSLKTLIQDPLATLASEIKSAKVKIAIDIPASLPLVLGDEIQLQQVLVNIIRNGLEAMSRKPAKTHELSIRGYEDASHRICLAINDTGPGILPEIQDRLFEQFNSSNPNGMGLGLAISKTIIDAHHGTIEAESQDGEGTTFVLSFPPANPS